MATGPGRRVHPLWEACAVRQWGLRPGGGSAGAAVPRDRVRTSGTASWAVTPLSLTGSVAALCRGSVAETPTDIPTVYLSIFLLPHN